MNSNTEKQSKFGTQIRNPNLEKPKIKTELHLNST